MRLRIRDDSATLLVSALSTLFAATLIVLTGILTAALPPELVEGSASFQLMLLMISTIFILLAFYVGAIVTANTFSTVIAGRTRTIALLRLVGATSRGVRARVAAEGLVVGLIGSLIGLGLAVALCAAVGAWGPQLGWLPEGRDYPIFHPLAAWSVVVVTLATWAAALAGSRRVGAVSPIEATGAAVEMKPEQSRSRTVRTVFAIMLAVGGFGLIALGLVVGSVSPFGLFISFLGGLSSFTGIALGAHLVMPPLLRLTGAPFRGSATGRLAAANSLRHPDRSSRSTIGLVVGVTLVVMFAVAMGSFETMMRSAMGDDPAFAAEIEGAFAIATAVFTGLVGFSAVIAAVGLVNTLSLNVMQRTRELGLLRTLGFTGAQVRRMVLAESAQMTLAALGFGLLLGVFYGWVAAQSLLGSEAGVVAPTVPWGIVAGVAGFGIVLALVAAAAPARRAIRVSPVAALAAE